MAAAQPESPATEAARSLEVRWIFPGELKIAVAGWFARFPAEEEAREDTYLLSPHLPRLSVKVRAGRALEVKMYRGSAGILDVAGRARGHMEFWQKWSFPSEPHSQKSRDLAGWQPVHKRRQISRFPLISSTVSGHAKGPGEGPGCAVELTEIRTRGQAWWSLGFEAAGPGNLLRDALVTTAALVFAEALPGGVELGTGDSRSYAEWLRRQAGTLSDTDA